VTREEGLKGLGAEGKNVETVSAGVKPGNPLPFNPYGF
jgi:hypothetical protein